MLSHLSFARLQVLTNSSQSFWSFVEILDTFIYFPSCAHGGAHSEEFVLSEVQQLLVGEDHQDRAVLVQPVIFQPADHRAHPRAGARLLLQTGPAGGARQTAQAFKLRLKYQTETKGEETVEM